MAGQSSAMIGLSWADVSVLGSQVFGQVFMDSCELSGPVAGRRSRSFHWDGRSACIFHMDGWPADQQGGRNDGAFPGDGKPGTVKGEEQVLPHRWLGRHILQL